MLTTHVGFILLTTVIAILWPLKKAFELPFLQSCTFEDEQCHIQFMEKFFEMYGDGIKELDIPSFDPMHLGDITIKGNSNEKFNLQLFMDNVDLYKFSTMKCVAVKGFTKDRTQPTLIVLKMNSPQLIIKTHCRIKGKLLLFTVAGEADLKIDIKNVTSTLKSKFSPYIKDGTTYYKTDEMKPRLDIGSISTSFANSTLFNGEQIFMDTFADTINANWQVFRDEMEPHLNKAVAKVAMEAANKVLATIPYGKYFSDVE